MYKKEKKSKSKKYIIILLFLLLLTMPLLLSSMGFISIDISSHGHGNVYKSRFSSFLSSIIGPGSILNIVEEDYDYIDEATGEAYCFDDECWDEKEEEYERCMTEVMPEVDFVSFSGSQQLVNSISLVGIDYDFTSGCEDAYYDSLVTECSIRCESETYVWDGTPVTNLGAFAENAFPNFVSNSRMFCNSWLFFAGEAGIWTQNANKIGCENVFLLYCDSRSLESAAEVCETIGKTWTCDFTQAYCEGF